MPQEQPERRAFPDPFLTFKFKVFVDGSDLAAGFSDVTGLGVETDVQTFRAGGVNNAEISLPGPTKFTTRLTLKRGMAVSRTSENGKAVHNTLWDWYQDVLRGVMSRRKVTVQMLHDTGEDGPKWVFDNALPVKWVGPDLHAGQAAIAFESIELVHRGLLPV